jgi:transglutaminase-like putative cysteine protease
MGQRAISRITLLVMLSVVPAFGGVTIPDWIRQASSQILPSYPPDTDAVVLLDDSTVTVSAPGEYNEHYRRVVKILRPSGRSYARLMAHLSGKDKLNHIHGWSIDSTGHEFEVKDKEFTETMLVSDSLYDDARLCEANAPAAAPGTIVGLEYDIERREFLNELHWGIQELNPVRKSVFTLQLPSGYEYKEQWIDTDPAKPQDLGSNRSQWIKTDLPGIEDEDYRPALRAMAARMQVTYFGTGSPTQSDGWDALGKWYNGLTADRRNSTPEISAKVQQLIAGKTDFDSKVRALTDFMQSEVRYVAIEIGVGGYQPHPAADIFRARYGDCKDKATLLSTMLLEAGIPSHYLIIHTSRGVARKEVPSSVFNHAILAIELPGGLDLPKYPSTVTSKSGQKLVLFDPTDSYTPLGYIGNHIQDRYALLVTPAGGEVIHTPILDPDIKRLVRRGTFKLTAEGAITGNVTELRSGDNASSWRARFRSYSDQERTKAIEQTLAQSITTSSLQNIKLEALEQKDKELVTSYEVSTNRYAQTAGQLLLFRPRVIGRFAFALEKKERKYPLVFDGNFRFENKYEIEIPSGYTVDDLPNSTKADSPFGSYESHFEATGSKIVYKRTYVRRALEVPTDKIAEFRAFNDRIAADENSVVVLKKAN